MQAVQSLDELTLPEKHKRFLHHFILSANKISNRHKIERLVLFGSCARGEANEKSDIDLVALGEKIDDETLWELYDCVPNYVQGEYVENDILVISNDLFNKHLNSFGMVQKYIEREGIDLSELLR